MYITKKDGKDEEGSLQVCTSHKAGSEVAIPAICDVYYYLQGETEIILLVDTERAFNSINSKAILPNITITYPLITTFIANCFMEPVRLFVEGNHEIKSREGTTQGDPTAIGATPLIYFLGNLFHLLKI